METYQVVLLVLWAVILGWKLISWIVHFSQKTKFGAQVSAGTQTPEGARKDSAEGANAAESKPKATVYVYRKSAFVGGLNPNYIHIDEVPVTNLKNGCYAVCGVEAGQHVLSSSGAASPIEVTLEGGREYFVRFRMSGVTGVFETVSKEEGSAEIRSMKRMRPDTVNARFGAA